MKTRHFLTTLAACALLYGCGAAPAFTQPEPEEKVAEATMMFTVTDVQSGAQVYFACAPIGTNDPVQKPTVPTFEVNHGLR